MNAAIKKTFITILILTVVAVVPFFIFTLSYLEDMNMLGHAGNCDNRLIPYEPLWIAAEAAFLVVFFLYIMLSANSSNTAPPFKFNRVLVILMLLNSAVMLGRCFEYPYISAKGGFPDVGDIIVGQYHPFRVLLPVSVALGAYFVIRFNSDMIRLGTVGKIIVFVLFALMIIASQYISFTAFYSECMG